MTIGDDESTFSNSQVVSVNGEEEKEYRPLNSRLSEVDETALNSPSLKPTSPFKINSNLKRDEYISEDESPRSPDKKKDSVKGKKKGKEKLSPDGKGFLSHMKTLLDESKIKFEKGSLDSLESPTDKKALSRASRKYRSKDSINISNLNENETNVYGSYNSINNSAINSDNEGPVRPRSRSKKLSLHDNLFGSQYSVEKNIDDDCYSARNRDTTESSSIITNDNSFLETSENVRMESRNSDIIREHEEDEGTLDEEKRKNSSNSGRRNGQGNIMIDKTQINSLINNNIKRDKESEIYLKEGYDWVVKDIHESHRATEEPEEPEEFEEDKPDTTS